jgi:hypothetical protein
MIKARKKILLLGNHDAKGAYNGLFNEIYTGPLFIADKILLSHEPVHGLTWCLNIHGHDHNNVEKYKEEFKPRDPERIPGILAELEKTWNRYPDLRLGQLIMDIVPNDSTRFNIEDDKMLDAIRAFDRSKGSEEE